MPTKSRTNNTQNVLKQRDFISPQNTLLIKDHNDSVSYKYK